MHRSRQFEAGTPAIAQAIGVGAAIEYLNTIGMDRIEKYEHELGAYLHRRLDEVPGVTVLGPSAEVEDRAALLSFVCEQVHPSDLSTFLIWTASPSVLDITLPAVCGPLIIE